jgi:MOSC domain
LATIIIEGEEMMNARVEAVFKSDMHTMSKLEQPRIQLLEGLGVEGDAHMGVTVKHRSRVAADPTQPNLRQVHLIHGELHDELQARGFRIDAGQMGENITTRGIDLLSLPKGTKMFLGETAMLEITGLRNPCTQLDGLQAGLMNAVLDRDEAGNLIRKAGIMGVVLADGEVKSGDKIQVELPAKPFEPLERV